MAHDEPIDLYEIIRRRYERGSTILTSNRDISECYTLFGDALLASSAMDRLLHQCEVVVMDGDSFKESIVETDGVGITLPGLNSRGERVEINPDLAFLPYADSEHERGCEWSPRSPPRCSSASAGTVRPRGRPSA